MRAGEPVIDLLVTTDGRRGAEVFGERLACGLAARGWQAELVSLWGSGESPRVDATILVPGARRGRWDRRVFVALLGRLRRRRPDVVFANGGSTLRYAALARWLSPWRFRLVYYSIGEPTYWAPGGATRLIQRVLMGAADQILAVSEPTRRQLIDDQGVGQGDVVTVPTGVPDTFFSIERGEPGPELVVLTMGSLSREKDPVAAVEVVAEVDTERPLVLRVVGTGPLGDVVLAAARDRGVRVEMVGSVDEPWRELARADVFLQTSQSEGLPGVVLEAGAAGIPVIAFDVGGVGDAMVDGESGFLIGDRSVSQAAEALRTLAEDDALRARMGARGRRHVRDRFALDPVVGRFDRILRAELAPTAEPERHV